MSAPIPCYECGEDEIHVLGERKYKRKGVFTQLFRAHCSNWHCKERGPARRSREEAVAAWNERQEAKP